MGGGGTVKRLREQDGFSDISSDGDEVLVELDAGMKREAEGAEIHPRLLEIFNNDLRPASDFEVLNETSQTVSST